MLFKLLIFIPVFFRIVHRPLEKSIPQNFWITKLVKVILNRENVIPQTSSKPLLRKINSRKHFMLIFFCSCDGVTYKTMYLHTQINLRLDSRLSSKTRPFKAHISVVFFIICKFCHRLNWSVFTRSVT